MLKFQHCSRHNFSFAFFSHSYAQSLDIFHQKWTKGESERTLKYFDINEYAYAYASSAVLVNIRMVSYSDNATISKCHL